MDFAPHIVIKKSGVGGSVPPNVVTATGLSQVRLTGRRVLALD